MQGNSIYQLLSIWYPLKDRYQWALATVAGVEGSSYRSIGAMMLMNELGQYYGLLSGGCLEADILRQARQVWQRCESRRLTYDMSEDEDIAWQLGIGCGGKVSILLQPVNAAYQYQQLDKLYLALNQGASCGYRIDLSALKATNQTRLLPAPVLQNSTQQQEKQLCVNVRPPVQLAVCGGGVDARPLVAMADTLGWQVTLIDPRTAYARKPDFPGAYRIVKQGYPELADKAWLQQLDAAVILHHNVTLDAQALMLMQQSSARYTGMLGPKHRTQKVLDEANLATLSQPLANPVGLRLGGELPESIALSILAEIHAFLFGQDAHSISSALCQQMSH